MAPSICALLCPPARELKDALAEQDTRPGTVVGHEGTLGTGLGRALASGADWIWVLDPCAIPRHGSLTALLDALYRTDELDPPTLLAGAVLGPGGEVDPARAPWYRRTPTESAMSAVALRLLPIRATGGPVLVHRDALQAERPPRPQLPRAGALLEWSARLMHSRSGYWVPQSEFELQANGAPTPRHALVAGALLLGGGFTGSDRLRVSFELLEQAMVRSREA